MMNSRVSLKELSEIQPSVPTASEIKDLILSVLDDAKAQNIKVLPLKGKTTIADYLLIASGTSERHLFALAQKVCDALSQQGLKGSHIEGENGSDWLLVDANDVIVHLFKPEKRALYDLETMWSGDFERLVAKMKPGKNKP